MSFQVILLFITTIVGTVFSYFLLRSDRKIINIIFSIFSISTATWALFLGLFLNTTILENALLYANTYYVAAAAIPLVFLYFTFYFQQDDRVFNKKYFWYAIPFLALVVGFLIDKNLIIKDVFHTVGGKDVILNEIVYSSYSIYFVAFVVFSYGFLLKKLSKTEDKQKRTQLKLVIAGTLVGFIVGTIFNLFLPALGDYGDIWVGPLSIIIMVISIGYGIIRHKLFNLKVVATELFIFSLWTFILIRTILSQTVADQIANGVLLAASIAVGIFLIRSVIKEVRQRERLERLTKDLESANEKLKELDQLKTEFLSLASHQFRSPLTAIKGYASLMLEGSYGQISDSVKEAITNIFKSASNLADVVQDFLDVSRIEQGRMKYEFDEVDLRETVEEISAELRPNIVSAGLDFKLNIERGVDYRVKADESRVKQVVINLIDNAQKYTKEGLITVSLERIGGEVVFSVKDTGVGIKKEDIQNLFGKFKRAKGANEINVKGTGLGLYIVKKIVEDHKGRVEVDSPGLGKGTTFKVFLKALE